LQTLDHDIPADTMTETSSTPYTMAMRRSKLTISGKGVPQDMDEVSCLYNLPIFSQPPLLGSYPRPHKLVDLLLLFPIGPKVLKGRIDSASERIQQQQNAL